MADFQFLQNPISKIWVVLAPRRAKRHDIAHEKSFTCPFCPGREGEDPEVFRIPSPVILGTSKTRTPESDNDGSWSSQDDSLSISQSFSEEWEVRVIKNKFSFAPIHEIVIHSPDHHKNFDELPLDQVVRIIAAYKERYLARQKDGAVYIFNNHGQEGGESIPHPHTQLVVLDHELVSEIQPLVAADEYYETPYFNLFCPQTSQWPDEVWIVPKRKETTFGEIEDVEVADLALNLQRVIQLFAMRHGYEFPYNFYIYPGKNWYLRLMPRVKSLGGFEVGTGIFVNTQDPKETLRFIRSNFASREIEELQEEEKADFAREV